jgi:hypothetical protein
MIICMVSVSAFMSDDTVTTNEVLLRLTSADRHTLAVGSSSSCPNQPCPSNVDQLSRIGWRL